MSDVFASLVERSRGEGLLLRPLHPLYRGDETAAPFEVAEEVPPGPARAGGPRAPRGPAPLPPRAPTAAPSQAPEPVPPGPFPPPPLPHVGTSSPAAGLAEEEPWPGPLSPPEVELAPPQAPVPDVSFS